MMTLPSIFGYFTAVSKPISTFDQIDEEIEFDPFYLVVKLGIAAKLAQEIACTNKATPLFITPKMIDGKHIPEIKLDFHPKDAVITVSQRSIIQIIKRTTSQRTTAPQDRNSLTLLQKYIRAAMKWLPPETHASLPYIYKKAIEGLTTLTETYTYPKGEKDFTARGLSDDIDFVTAVLEKKSQPECSKEWQSLLKLKIPYENATVEEYFQSYIKRSWEPEVLVTIEGIFKSSFKTAFDPLKALEATIENYPDGFLKAKRTLRDHLAAEEACTFQGKEVQAFDLDEMDAQNV